MRVRPVDITIGFIGVAAAMAAVWVRWTYFSPSCAYLPNHELIIPVVAFVLIGVVGAVIGMATVRRTGWRVTFRITAAALLVAVVGLPIKADWLARAPKVRTWRPGPVPGRSQEESLVTVQTLPKFRAEQEFKVMVLTAPAGQSYQVIYFGDSDSSWLRTMPRDKPLRFTVWHTKNVISHYEDGEEDIVWSDEIETIRDGSELIYDARECPLHHIPMERAEIPVMIGLPSPAFLEAVKAFSGGPGFILGGCVYTEGMARSMRGYRCSTCVTLYAKWQAEERKRIEQLRESYQGSPN